MERWIDKESLELRDKLFPQTTYLDLFSLALARTKHSTFTSKSQQWNDVIFSLKKQFEEELPQFFSDIVFDTRNPNKPRSEEVASFISHLRRSNILEEYGLSSDSRFEISNESKKAISDGESSYSLKSFTTPINEIATIFDERLGIPPTPLS